MVFFTMYGRRRWPDSFATVPYPFGSPIYDIIGYAETREAGNIMLAEYNRDPWDVDRAKITLHCHSNLWFSSQCMGGGVGLIALQPFHTRLDFALYHLNFQNC